MKAKVIIVDDHRLFNDGLSLILKEESDYFEVEKQIFDSRQAEYYCLNINPDLVLVDFNMPHLNGLAVVKQLKTLSANFKIVVISMYAENKEIKQFKDAGVDGYLTKIMPAFELIVALKKILSGEKIFDTGIPQKQLLEQDSFAKQYQLTKREIEILRVLKKGFTTEQVAKDLNLSFYTVETHRKNINQKLQFKTKKEFYEFLDTVDFDK
jgi:DNA-binding NarL/FixJ family response regulator